jgi:hypothetical protein
MEHRIDDKVTMGRLNNPTYNDNTLRVYSNDRDTTTIQLRYESWYLVRQLNRNELIELISVLSSELQNQTKAKTEELV